MSVGRDYSENRRKEKIGQARRRKGCGRNEKSRRKGENRRKESKEKERERMLETLAGMRRT